MTVWTYPPQIPTFKGFDRDTPTTISSYKTFHYDFLEHLEDMFSLYA